MRKKKRTEKNPKIKHGWYSGSNWFRVGESGPCTMVTDGKVIEVKEPKKYISYPEYLKSDHWKKLRRKKYAKVKNKRCCICGTDRNLQVHHLDYKKNWLKVRTKDLRLLCDYCHETLHSLIKRGQLKQYERAKNNTHKFKIMVKGVAEERKARELHQILDDELAAIVT